MLKKDDINRRKRKLRRKGQKQLRIWQRRVSREQRIIARRKDIEGEDKFNQVEENKENSNKKKRKEIME